MPIGTFSRESHILPSVEHLLANIVNATVFSGVNLRLRFPDTNEEH